MENYITILAWIFGSLSTALTIIRILGWLMYSDLERTLDQLQGYTIKFPIVVPGTIAILCWVWVLH